MLYDASTSTELDGSRMPSQNELSIAEFQGKHVSTITKNLYP